MERRIVIYDNTNGKGEVLASFTQHVSNRNKSILERDIAHLILKMENDNKYSINPLLVASYIEVSKGKRGGFSLGLDAIFNYSDYKPAAEKESKRIVCPDTTGTGE